MNECISRLEFIWIKNCFTVLHNKLNVILKTILYKWQNDANNLPISLVSVSPESCKFFFASYSSKVNSPEKCEINVLNLEKS